jgi:hypothetical protein
MYVVFAPYSPSYTTSFPTSHWYQLPSQNSQDLFFPPVLHFCKRKKNDIFVCLR